MSKQKLLYALQSPRAMEKYLESCSASEVIADIKEAMYPEQTLRDYFAGQALAGLLAGWPQNEGIDLEPVAVSTYELADAMLAAREKS